MFHCCFRPPNFQFLLFPHHTPLFSFMQTCWEASIIGLSEDRCLVHLSPALLISPSKTHCFPISCDLPSFHHPLRVINLLSLSTFLSFVSGVFFSVWNKSVFSHLFPHESSCLPGLNEVGHLVGFLLACDQTEKYEPVFAFQQSLRLSRVRHGWTESQLLLFFIIFMGFLVEMVDEEDGSVEGWWGKKGDKLEGECRG